MRDLPDNQRILLEYMFGVSFGTVNEKFSKRNTVDEKFSKRKPGPENCSGWLTPATRILYLYTRTKQPSQVLKLLSTYIVRVHGPIWINYLKWPEIFLQ